jgi:SAM-dependent methyltransferase
MKNNQSMNFKEIKDILEFLGKSNWQGVGQRDNALAVSLTPKNIDDIFDMITQNTKSPLIYESGCGAGDATAQICEYLSKKGIKEYKLVAHDVDEHLLKLARNRFARDNRIILELRSSFNYADVPNESVDAIFSFSAIVPFLHMYFTKSEDNSQHKEYLEATSRVLKEGKPLVLTWSQVPLVLVKDSKIETIPFQVKVYDEHDGVKPFLRLLEFVEPINNFDYLEELLSKGYTIKGPRNNLAGDLNSFKLFLKKGIEFAPEEWLSSRGYQFVEPNTFTKGHRISYKLINGFPDERFKSNYCLLKGERKIPLYLKVPK